VKLLAVFLFVLTFTSSTCFAQFPRQKEDPVETEMHQKMERDRVKALNKERQASLKKDMDKLYQLATELKQAVDKTDENMLSVQVVRKTEEIEKLAKNIRQKMRDAY
jgi:ATP-dependent helicase/DNAse subunit B